MLNQRTTNLSLTLKVHYIKSNYQFNRQRFLPPKTLERITLTKA